MPSFFTDLLTLPLPQALMVLLAIGIAERMGIPIVSMIKSMLRLNDKNGNGHLKELEDKLTLMESNHLHGINTVLTENNKMLTELVFLMKELQSDVKAQNTYVAGILKDFLKR